MSRSPRLSGPQTTQARRAQPPTPIILDCDPGHDDALAILLALALPEIELLAVTTVAGNVPLAATTRNAGAILALADRADLPFAAGADRPWSASSARPPSCTGIRAWKALPCPSLSIPIRAAPWR